MLDVKERCAFKPQFTHGMATTKDADCWKLSSFPHR